MKSETAAGVQSPREILEELRELVAEAEKVLGNAPPGPAGEGTMAGLYERLEAARAKIKGADTAVRENPYQALAIAAGIGLLMGLIISRRR